jgi:GTP-binding protein
MEHRLVSAKTGRGVEEALSSAVAVVDERRKRIPTAELHRMLVEAVSAHPPPSDRSGHEVRFHHVTQARGPAPTFVFFVDRPAAVHFSYQRYLENRIRERFGFHGTPLKLELRGARE